MISCVFSTYLVTLVWSEILESILRSWLQRMLNTGIAILQRLYACCWGMQAWLGAPSASSPMGMLSLHMLKLGCPYTIALLWREFICTVADQHCHKLRRVGGRYTGTCMYSVGRRLAASESACSHPGTATAPFSRCDSGGTSFLGKITCLNRSMCRQAVGHVYPSRQEGSDERNK